MKKRKRTPVRVSSHPDPQHPTGPPVLSFSRRYPACTWMVPCVTTPLYWLDEKMHARGLITRIPPDHFVADGRRFKVLARDRSQGFTRWLVCEEHPLIPPP